ncbi:hypothetical protein COCOBI_05-6400 [Coccomyxa sp. Obi]|nr:hypothetical protein COCOBI_05-6400 [Coccomyxa sp. Obi]
MAVNSEILEANLAYSCQLNWQDLAILHRGYKHIYREAVRGISVCQQQAGCALLARNHMRPDQWRHHAVHPLLEKGEIIIRGHLERAIEQDWV